MYTAFLMVCYLWQAWVGAPAIYVFDCSAAGLILNSFRAFAEQRAHVCTPLPAHKATHHSHVRQGIFSL